MKSYIQKRIPAIIRQRGLAVTRQWILVFIRRRGPVIIRQWILAVTRRRGLAVTRRRGLAVLMAGMLSVTAGAQVDTAFHYLPEEPYAADHPDPATGTADSLSLFHIRHIIISGNNKTKPYIILRELNFKEGDLLTLPDLVSRFEHAREQLYNTRLFNGVVVALKGFSGYDVDIDVSVKERWYLFPLPYLKPIDRNLSVWADKGYSLSRLDYGMKLSYYNFSGRNDKLKAWLVTGYSRQFRFSYEQPYSDNALKHGFLVNFAYNKLREINAFTQNNTQQFLKSDSIPGAGRYLEDYLNFTAGYTYRPAIRTRHSIRLGFTANKIDSAVFRQNPHYFGNGRTRIYYPEIRYDVDYNHIDYVGYPLKGELLQAGIIKKGIRKPVSLLELYAKGTVGREIGPRLYYGFQGFFSLKLPFDQPFSLQKQMGYEDVYLRGLEKYVIDGVAVTLARNTLRREILRFIVPTPYLHSRSHDRIPFRIYLKAYGDAGYVYNKSPSPYALSNSLVNKMLFTAGAGLDVVTLYDVVVRFEYSFNQLGQNGLFLHFKNEF